MANEVSAPGHSFKPLDYLEPVRDVLPLKVSNGVLLRVSNGLELLFFDIDIATARTQAHLREWHNQLGSHFATYCKMGSLFHGRGR